VLRIEQVDVGPRRVEARVRVVDPRFLRTTSVPGLAQAADSLLPGLKRHTCENDDGRSFLRELADTETPHLLEHVAAELMALSGSPRSLKASTSWDFAADGQGVFRVSLEYDDDLVAVGALKEAQPVVEWLLSSVDSGAVLSPDIDAAVARLRAARG
jgi:hypothetical protein